jgi:CRISPR-associated protein Cas2
MYVIIVYDVDVERVSKVNKFLKCYLNWKQNSVFEGEITESQLEKIKVGLKELIDSSVDSVLIYKLPSKKNMEMEVIGTDKSPITRIF